MLKDILGSVAARFGAAGFGFLVLIYTSRELGVELRGELAYVLTLTLTIAATISFSIENAYVSYQKACGREINHSSYFVYLLILSSISFTVTFFLAHFLLLVPLGQNLLICSLTSLSLLSKTLIGIYLKDGEVNKYNKNIFITKAGYFVFAIVAVSFLELGVKGVLFALLISLVISLLIVFREKRILNVNLKRFQLDVFFIRHSFSVHATSIGTILISQVPIILIGVYGTREDVGLFDVSMQLIGVVTLVVSSLSPVIYSTLARLTDKEGTDITLRLVKVAYIAFLPIFLSLYWLAADTLEILFGEQYLGATGVFRTLLVMAYFSLLSYFVCPIWVVNGASLKLSLVTVCIGLINTISTYFIMQTGSIEGVAVIMAGTSFIFFSCHCLFLASRFGLNLSLKSR